MNMSCHTHTHDKEHYIIDGRLSHSQRHTHTHVYV